VRKISTAKIKSQAANKKVTIGMDLGDRSSRYCLLDEEGVVIGEASTPTTKAGIAKVFGAMARCRIALEAGGHSPWVSRLLEELGHEVIVANPRNVRLIGESTRKDDRLDARTLARLARIDPMLLSPVRHRGAEAQADLAVIRARRALVKARTMLINAARGLVACIFATVIVGISATRPGSPTASCARPGQGPAVIRTNLLIRENGRLCPGGVAAPPVGRHRTFYRSRTNEINLLTSTGLLMEGTKHFSIG
jgi:Transposase